MKKIIILLCIFFVTSLSAQLKVDSLKSLLKNVSGKEKVDLLNKISAEYKDKSLPSETAEYANQALELSEKIEYRGYSRFKE